MEFGNRARVISGLGPTIEHAAWPRLSLRKACAFTSRRRGAAL